MSDYIKFFGKNQNIQSALDLLNDSRYSLYLYNSNRHVNNLFTSLVYLTKEKTVFYITPNLYQATQSYERFCQLLGPENVNLYAMDEIVSAEILAASYELRLERMNTIKDILTGNAKVIVTHTYAILKPLVNREILQNNIIHIKTSDVLDIEKFIKQLIKLGYKKTPTTYSVGDFSVRGGVIDIFPLSQEKPIRLDLFDNEIEKIKVFNPETQLSVDAIESVSIFPLYEILYDLDYADEIASKIVQNVKDSNHEKLSKDIVDIKTYNNLDRLSKYINYIDSTHQIIIDYLDDSILFFEDFNRTKDNFTQLNNDLYNYLISEKYPKEINFKFFEDVYVLSNYPKSVYFSEHLSNVDVKLTDTYDLNTLNIVNYDNNIKGFIEDLRHNNYTYVITISTDHQFRMIQEILNTNQIKYYLPQSFNDIKENNINLIQYENSISFAFLEPKLEVITEREIFKDLKYRKTRYKSVYQHTTHISTKDDISIGDYVVHYDYGIALYKGLKTIELQNIKTDYLWLQYEDMELYVPLEDLHLIEKYVASEGTVPKLTKLSTKDWERRKQKIKDKIQNMAKELIRIQALRTQSKGFKFPKDDELTKIFESDFEYEETPDQLKAIEEVKRDMESDTIMDRLICGDVGYGKTEIAIRASFKAVMGGKQVLYLAPTTILSRQHYQTFTNRFSKFGIRVAELSRLVPFAMQKQILKDLKEGQIDILIGTHRVLSDDVVFKDLGLLIIDEEQRFGVVHKEKIKQLKHNVEVLTLTATPIPRTLQMSIMGIRSISLLETPPLDRYPVQTFVLEENDIVIREAIYRELARNGQVFYLHNRISNLDRLYRKIKKLVPEARIAIGHGQMPRDELEDIIQSFIDRQYDVLLCTTIIETGIDIPNANTLIISDADRLGLSQIYQLRGRVGRSDRIAYAYLMYSKNKVLTDASKKRLDAIKEFTELGSGYKIALRDLAIRGAGDILGKEQSGFIDAVGLDMYMKLLNEAIMELQNKEVIKPEKQKVYNIDISKHVPKEYVSDEEIRILIHQEIFKIKSKDDKEQLIQKLTDQFGRLTEELLLYIERKYLEILMNQAKVSRFFENEREVRITFSQDTTNKLDIYKLYEFSTQFGKEISFEYKNKEFIAKFDKKGYNSHWVFLASRFLENINTFLKMV